MIRSLILLALVMCSFSFEPIATTIDSLSTEGCSTQVNNAAYKYESNWEYAPSAIGTQDGVLVQKAGAGAWMLHDASFVDQEFDQLGIFFTILGSPEELWYFAMPNGKPWLAESDCYDTPASSDCWASQIVGWYTGESMDLPINSEVTGVFPGYDFVIFTYDDSSSSYGGFLRISFARSTWGSYEDLDISMVIDPYTCEYHSIWGIAESYNGKTYLTFNRADEIMVRQELVDDSETEDLGLDLTDMDLCSFSVSLEHQLWAFHMESGFESSDSLLSTSGHETIARCPAEILVDDALGEIYIQSVSFDLLECDTARGTNQANIVWDERNPGFMADDRGGVAITDTTLFFAGDRALGVLPVDFHGNGHGPAIRIYANGQYYNLGNADGEHSVLDLPARLNDDNTDLEFEITIDRLIADDGTELLLGQDLTVIDYNLTIFLGVDGDSAVFRTGDYMLLEFDFNSQTSAVLDLDNTDISALANNDDDSIYQVFFYRQLASGEYIFYSSGSDDETMHVCVTDLGTTDLQCESVDYGEVYPVASSVAYQDGNVYFWQTFHDEFLNAVATCSVELLEESPYITIDPQCSVVWVKFLGLPLAPLVAAGDEMLFRTAVDPYYVAPISQFDAQWGWEWANSMTAGFPALWFSVLERPFVFATSDGEFYTSSYDTPSLIEPWTQLYDLANNNQIDLTHNGEETELGPYVQAAVFAGSDFAIVHGVVNESYAEYWVVSVADDTIGEVMRLDDSEILFDVHSDVSSYFSPDPNARARTCDYQAYTFFGVATYHDGEFSILYINFGDYIIEKTLADDGSEGASTIKVEMPRGTRQEGERWQWPAYDSFGACSLFVSYTTHQWYTDVAFGGFHMRAEYYSSGRSSYYYDTLVRCPLDFGECDGDFCADDNDYSGVSMISPSLFLVFGLGLIRILD